MMHRIKTGFSKIMTGTLLFLICYSTQAQPSPFLSGIPAPNPPKSGLLPGLGGGTAGGGDASGLGGLQAILAKIESETASILNQVNKLPTLVNNISAMALSWTNTNDPNNVITNLATDPNGNFTSLNNNYNTMYTSQIDLAKTYTTKFLVQGSEDPINHPTLPFNPNGLFYGALQGVLILPPVPQRTAFGAGSSVFNKINQAAVNKAQQDFIQNISAVNLVFQQPKKSWKDSPLKTQFTNMYQTTTAIASFNTYLLTSLFSQQQTQDSIRNNLLSQATNNGWFTTIASETLGLVLRQILVYTSQNYVQLDRLIKIQQQQLAAQAVTNTLLDIQTNSMLTQNITNAINQQQTVNSSAGYTD